jgi:hypothetical protein
MSISAIAGRPAAEAIPLPHLRAPTLLVYGDADSVPPVHAAAFFALLGGGKEDTGWDRTKMLASRLAILPSTTLYDIFSSPLLAAVVTPFLDAPQPATEAAKVQAWPATTTVSLRASCPGVLARRHGVAGRR